jgi:hypothetical protein
MKRDVKERKEELRTSSVLPEQNMNSLVVEIRKDARAIYILQKNGYPMLIVRSF